MKDDEARALGLEPLSPAGKVLADRMERRLREGCAAAGIEHLTPLTIPDVKRIAEEAMRGAIVETVAEEMRVEADPADPNRVNVFVSPEWADMLARFVKC